MKDTTSDKGKPKLSLIVPDFLLGMAEVLTNGRGAHDEWSFLGETVDDQYNSLMRHVLAFRRGENLDGESGSHPLLHAACRIMFMWYLAQLRDKGGWLEWKEGNTIHSEYVEVKTREGDTGVIPVDEFYWRTTGGDKSIVAYRPLKSAPYVAKKDGSLERVEREPGAITPITEEELERMLKQRYIRGTYT